MTTDHLTRRTRSGPRSVLANHRAADAAPSRAATVDRRLADAVELHVDGDLDAAIAVYRALLDDDPTDRVVANNLGLALLQAGRPDDALAVLRTLEPVEDMTPTALVNLANAHVAVGDATTGVRLLERAVTFSADSTAWMSLGKARLVSGDIAGAASAFETTVGLFPGRTDAWQLLAACLASLGDDGALDALRVAADQRPDDPSLWRQISALLLARADIGSAVAMARRSVALAPDDPRNRHQLAIALVALGDARAAAAELDRVLAEGSGSVAFEAAALDRAVIALSEGDRDRARELLAPRTQNGPSAMRARYLLAQLELTEGNVDEARALLTKVASSDANEAEGARALLDQIV